MSQSTVPESEVVDFKLPKVKSAQTIKVMKVVLDRRNAKERLPGLKQGFEVMETIKNARGNLFDQRSRSEYTNEQRGNIILSMLHLLLAKTKTSDDTTCNTTTRYMT